jgi:hypothetical protein
LALSKRALARSGEGGKASATHGRGRHQRRHSARARGPSPAVCGSGVPRPLAAGASGHDGAGVTRPRALAQRRRPGSGRDRPRPRPRRGHHGPWRGRYERRSAWARPAPGRQLRPARVLSKAGAAGLGLPARARPWLATARRCDQPTAPRAWAWPPVPRRSRGEPLRRRGSVWPPARGRGWPPARARLAPARARLATGAAARRARRGWIAPPWRRRLPAGAVRVRKTLTDPIYIGCVGLLVGRWAVQRDQIGPFGLFYHLSFYFLQILV